MAIESTSYKAVAAALRSELREGAFKFGDRLPTEAQLTRQHGVSRGTVRRAYLELVSEGLVNRVRGRGTFPRRLPPYRRSFGSVEELLSLSEDSLMQVVLPLEEITDADAAVALGLQFDTVARLSYVRLSHEATFAYTEVYVPPRLVSDLASFTFLFTAGSRNQATVLGILDRELPSPITGSREVVTAVTASSEVASQIGCEEGEPVLRIERTHFVGDDGPVEHCVNWFNPERYVYRLHLHRRSP